MGLYVLRDKRIPVGPQYALAYAHDLGGVTLIKWTRKFTHIADAENHRGRLSDPDDWAVVPVPAELLDALTGQYRDRTDPTT